jgi:hypothetical protein
MSRAAPLLAIAFVCSSYGSGGRLRAQGVATRIAPGDVVRFSPSPPGPRVRGKVAWISGDSLWLDRGSPPSQSLVLRKDIAGMERPLPGPDGAFVGALSGLALGAGFGVYAGHEACESACEGGGGHAGFAVLGAGVFGALGALAGAVIGAVTHPVRWTLASWPTNNGPALGASVPFRLPE